MAFTISDAILQAARMSEAELRQEIAVLLYSKDKLTLTQASRFAEMGESELQHLLASRRISPRYDVEDFLQDLETLRASGRL